jgi:hypothetical protein
MAPVYSTLIHLMNFFSTATHPAGEVTFRLKSHTAWNSSLYELEASAVGLFLLVNCPHYTGLPLF